MINKKLILLALGLYSLGASLLATTDAVMLRMYGNRYDSQVGQQVSLGSSAQFDTTFGANGGKDLSSQLGSGVVIKAMAIDSYGWLYVAADNGSTNVKLARFDADGVLDAQFGSSGIATINQKNAKDVYVDTNGHVVVCGGDGSAAGWITRYHGVTGVLDTAFTVGSVATLPSGVIPVKIVEQKSGRLIVGATNGRLYAFRSTGVADTTFNPNMTSANYMTAGVNGIFNIIVDDNDDMLIAYVNSTIKFSKVESDGSALITSYGTAGIFNTGYTPSSESNVKLVQDNNGNIVLVYTDANSVLRFCRYTSDAVTLDTTFSSDGLQALSSLGTSGQFRNITTLGSFSAGQLYFDQPSGEIRKVSDDTVMTTIVSSTYAAPVYTITSSLVATYQGDYRKVSISLADVAVDENNQLVALVIDDNSTKVTSLVRLNDDGSFDADFKSGVTDGVVTDTANSLDAVYALGVHPDGQLFIVGDDIYSSASHAKFVRIFGDVYDGQYVQAQQVQLAGLFDSTFNNSGEFNIASAYSLTGYYIRQMYIYENGYQLLALDNGTDTKIVKLQPDKTVDTSFGTSGIVTLTGLSAVKDLWVHQDSSIYVSGGLTSGWLRRLYNNGFPAVIYQNAGLTSVRKIFTQTCGRIIALGTDGSAGKLVGYQPSGLVESAVFGQSGYVTLTDANGGALSALSDGVVDSYDRIFTINKNATTAKMEVQRVTEYGALDTLFGTGGRISTIASVSSSTAMKIAIDNNNDQIVIAAITNAGALALRCYDLNGNLVGSERTVATVDVLTALFIDDARHVYAVGMRSGNIVVTRLTIGSSTFAFDTTYGTNGVSLITSATHITTATDAFLHPDRRLMICGYGSGSDTAYMTRLFGNSYDLKLSEAIDLATAGTEDIYVFNKSTGVVDLSGSVSNGLVKTLTLLSDATILATVDTAAATKLVKLTKGAFGLDTSWQGDGIANSTAPTGVQDLYVDQADGYVMTGAQSGAAWLTRYTDSGDLDTAFGSSGYATTLLTAGNKVLQQASGRILVLGYNGSNGAIQSFSSSGIQDNTFGSGTSLYATGTNAFYTGLIDGQDRIIVAYKNGVNVDIIAVRANGIGLDNSFATSGVVSNAISNVVAADQIRVIKDANNKILVLAATSSGVYLRRYASNGSLDTSFNSTGAALQVSSTAGMRISDISLDSNGVIAIAGYDSTAVNDRSWVARVQYDGSSVLSSLSYEIASVDNTGQANTLVVYPDGRLLVGGYENNGSNNKPKITRVYHSPFVTELSQFIEAGPQGSYDVVVEGDGIAVVQFSTDAREQYGRAVVDLADGKVLVGAYGYTQADTDYYHAIIARVGTDGQIDSSFGSAGIITPALYVDESYNILGGDEYLYALGTDHHHKIIAVGYQENEAGTSVGIIRRILANGSSLDSTFNSTGAVPGTAVLNRSELYAFGFQSNERIIAVGKDTNVGRGILLGCRSNGILDTTFGAANAKAYIEDAQAIYSVVIDADDNILCAYLADNGDINVAKLVSTGFSLAYDYGVNGIATAVLPDGTRPETVHLAIDADGNVVVGASSYGYEGEGYSILATRLLPDGSVDESFNDGYIAEIAYDEINELYLQKIIIADTGTVNFVGYIDTYDNTQDSLLFVRLTSDGYFDTDFYGDGINIADTQEGDGYQTVHDAVILTEGKIFSVGSVLAYGTEYNNTLLVSIYAEQYQAGLSRYPAFVPDNGLDPAYGTSGVVADFVSGTYGRGVKILPNGYSVVAVDDTHDSQYLVQFTDAGQLDTVFADGGYAFIDIHEDSSNETITDFIIDGRGRYIVVGYSLEKGAFVKRLTEDGYMDESFNGTGYAYDSSMSRINSVVEVSAGLIIVGGINNAGTGVIKAYLSSDGSRVTTSGSLGGFGINGVYTDSSTGSSGVYSLVADSKDNIYAAIGYSNGGFKTRIVKLDYLGTKQTGFATAGIINTAMSNLYDKSMIRIALDYENRIVLAGSKTNGTIAVKRFTIIGGADEDFNAGNEITFGSTGGVYNVVTDIVGLQNNSVIVSGYKDDMETGSSADRLLLARVLDIGTLDTEFNTTGLYEFVSSSGQQDSRLTSFDIQADGKIVATGFDTNPGSYVRPILIRAHAEDYIPAVPQYIGSGFVGTADKTFGLYNDGISRVYFTIEHSISQYGAGIYAFVDQKPIVYGYGYTDLDYDNQHMISQRLTQSGDHDATYGGGAGVMPGTIVSGLSSGYSEIANHVLVDYEGRFLVGGYIQGDINQALLRRYSKNGAVDTTFATNGVTTYTANTTGSEIKALGIQGQGGYIIAAGNKDGVGFVNRYFTTGYIDKTFGKNGSFAKLEDVQSALVGPNDIIYVLQKTNDHKIQIAALKKNGASLYAPFATKGRLDVFSEVTSTNGMWLAIDSQNRLVVAVSINDGDLSYIAVVRYLIDGTLDASFNLDGEHWSTDSSDVINGLSRVLVAKNDKIVLVGYEDSVNQDEDYFLVARLTENLELDETFGEYEDGFFTARAYTPGGIDCRLADGYIMPNGKILLVGNERPVQGGSTPIVLRINGDFGYGQVQQYPVFTGAVNNGLPSGQSGSSAGSSTVQQQSANLAEGLPGLIGHAYASSSAVAGAGSYATPQSGWNAGGVVGGGWGSHRRGISEEKKSLATAGQNTMGRNSGLKAVMAAGFTAKQMNKGATTGWSKQTGRK